MPITLELALVDDPLESIVSILPFANCGFTHANTSVIWQIQNVQAKCDLISPDSGLNESYIK